VETAGHDADRTPRREGRGPVLLLVALAGLAAGTVLTTWARWERGVPASAPASAPAAAQRYQCPMHPSVVRDRPGECPICGMQLVPGEGPRRDEDHRAASAPEPHDVGDRAVAFYRSPMNPNQTSPVPRKDEMGMDYLPVYEDELQGDDTVAELATVKIDPARQQLIGLRTEAVTRGEFGGSWRTVGRVAVDETRVRHINVKVAGFVERIFVDFVGRAVKRGEPLFALYSPELLSAQEEYLLALRTSRTLGESGLLARDGQALVASARRRLELWDIPSAEIDRLTRSGKATKTLTLFSPISGVVTKKDVVQGMWLDVGAMPYEIVDLSQVWVLADVYENELRWITVGMPATLTLRAFPNRTFTGRVVFLDPMLNPDTRTAKVRLVFANPSGALRPDMFGEVVLQGRSRETLRIPVDAVIHSGTRTIAFVALGDGKFQPREVVLGDSDRENVEVVSGLRAGERVVTRANFLVDSESSLRASLAAMAPSTDTPLAGPPGPAPAGPSDGHRGH
jgi:Cu(I)/Ag(I) efflux system membrane fusion protein